MALQYRDDTNGTGIVNLIWEWTGTNSSSYPVEKVTRDVNLALDEFNVLSVTSDGTWKNDNTTHEGLPVVRTSLVSGQRDYTLRQDDDNNYVTEIYKVFAKDSSGDYYEVKPIDLLDTTDFHAYQSMTEDEATGQPYAYGKMKDGIFLQPVPNYSISEGLKVVIGRQQDYYLPTDTTKVSGIHPDFTEFQVLRPVYMWMLKNKAFESIQTIKNELDAMRVAIVDRYDKRSNITSIIKPKNKLAR